MFQLYYAHIRIGWISFVVGMCQYEAYKFPGFKYENKYRPMVFLYEYFIKALDRTVIKIRKYNRNLESTWFEVEILSEIVQLYNQS